MPARFIAADDFLWLVDSLCQLHRVPFDPALITRHCPPPHDTAQLLRELGFPLPPATPRLTRHIQDRAHRWCQWRWRPARRPARAAGPA